MEVSGLGSRAQSNKVNTHPGTNNDVGKRKAEQPLVDSEVESLRRSKRLKAMNERSNI